MGAKMTEAQFAEFLGLVKAGAAGIEMPDGRTAILRRVVVGDREFKIVIDEEIPEEDLHLIVAQVVGDAQ
jgi:hypothetical protein